MVLPAAEICSSAFGIFGDLIDLGTQVCRAGSALLDALVEGFFECSKGRSVACCRGIVCIDLSMSTMIRGASIGASAAWMD